MFAIPTVINQLGKYGEYLLVILTLLICGVLYGWLYSIIYSICSTVAIAPSAGTLVSKVAKRFFLLVFKVQMYL